MDVTTVQSNDLAQMQQLTRQAGKVLTQGGLVVFPTETVYGIAASATSDTGVQALQQFKDRCDDKPFTLHLAAPAEAGKYIDLDEPMVRRLIRKVFPGPVTLVVHVAGSVIGDRLKAQGLSEAVGARLYHQNTVGLRCPDHALGRAILGAIDGPIIASSANRRAQHPPHDAQQAAEAVGGAAALIVDGGPCRYAKASTVVRIGAPGGGAQAVTIEREGVYDQRFIRKLLRWTMLLVCTGNTCRSPMATVLAKSMLAQQRGIKVDELDSAGLRVISAGVYAPAQMSASPEAVDAMSRLGLDLSQHRSQPLTVELLHEADVVYCMTEEHRRAIVAMMPTVADKVFTLDPNGDVDDPIGSDLTTYQRCAEVIRRRLEQRLKEQMP